MKSLQPRFGGDSISWPLWLRVVATVPFVVVGYVLTRSLVLSAIDGEPGAVIPFVLLGVLLLYGIPFLRQVWRSNEAWRQKQVRDDAEERHRQLMAERRSAYEDPAGQ